MPESQKYNNLLAEAKTPLKTAFWLAFFFSLFVNLLVLALPIYTLQLFDRVLSSQSVPTLISLTVIVIFLLAIQSGLDFIRGGALRLAGKKFETKLSGTILSVALREASYGNPYASSGLQDAKEVRSALANPSFTAIFDAPWAPLFLLLLYAIHPSMGMFVLAAIVVLGFLTFLNLASAKRPQTEEAKEIMDAGESAMNYMQNAEAIRALGMERVLAKTWHDNTDRVLTLNMKVIRTVSIVLGFTKFIRQGVQIGIMGLGAYLVIQAEISPGAMIAASILMARALAPAEQAVNGWKSWQTALTSYRNLEQAFKDMDERDQEYETSLPAPVGNISLNGVGYRVDEDQPVILKGVNLRLDAGNALGVIGPSGAGKSTLLRLVAGIMPPSVGEIRIDSAEIRQWDMSDLGKYIGYMPQDVQLVTGTIAENISRFQEDATSDEIIAAAKKAHVHDLILHLPHGYDTLIGTGGVRLSGGQMQRVGLARALFRDPPILLLDEPNSHLDPLGEEALADALNTEKERGVSIIVVSQRSSLLKGMDWLIVMRDGQIDKAGPRKQVMSQLRLSAGQPENPSQIEQQRNQNPPSEKANGEENSQQGEPQ